MTRDELQSRIFAYLLRTHGRLPRGEVDPDTFKAYLAESPLPPFRRRSWRVV